MIAPTPRHPTALPSPQGEWGQGKRGIGKDNKAGGYERVQGTTQAAELDAAYGRAALGLRSCPASPPPPINGDPSANANKGRERVAPTEQHATMRTGPTSPTTLGHVRVRGIGGSVTSVRVAKLSNVTDHTGRHSLTSFCPARNFQQHVFPVHVMAVSAFSETNRNTSGEQPDPMKFCFL